jgi:hypothetical protein
MIKMIAALCRRPGMTHAEYLAYVQHVHGRLATDEPAGLRRYVQNHVFDAAFGSLADTAHTQPVARDSVTELYWDSPEDMKANFAHEHVRTKVGPDGANFSAKDLQLSLVATEVEQPVANPGPGRGAKVLHFMRAAEGLALPTFFERWAKAHARALDTTPQASAALRRCVHNHQLPAFNPMLAYFGGLDVPIYEGAASLWFDDATSLSAFRAYERALLAINAEPGSAFYQPASSFFLYATEVPIYQR